MRQALSKKIILNDMTVQRVKHASVAYIVQSKAALAAFCGELRRNIIVPKKGTKMTGHDHKNNISLTYDNSGVIYTKSERLIMLDAIKGMCIIMVILTHVYGLSDETKRLILYPFTILPAVPMFLMLSSYSFSLSAKKKSVYCISDYFEIKRFWKRVDRLLFPFAVNILLQIVLLKTIAHTSKITITDLYRIVSLGGRGPASYYIAVIIQFVVLFPFLRKAFDKKPELTFCMMSVIYFSYEFLIQEFLTLSTVLSDRLIFHFFPQIALGFILYDYRGVLSKTAIPLISLIIGIWYILSYYYFGYHPAISANDSRGIFSSLYSFGALCYLLNLEKLASKYKKLLSPLRYIGKASYHIMIAQMTIFYFMRLKEFENRFPSVWLSILFDLIICISAGCIFYALDSSFRKFCSKKFRPLAKKGENNVC